MSYFSCDIPYMSDKELEENSIHIPKDISDNNIGNIGYIRKQDMLDAVEKLDIIPSVDGVGIPTDAEDFRVQFIGTVLRIKPADVVSVVHGKWLPTNDEDKKRCNKCDTVVLIAMYPMGNANFCPNCGAKMDAHGEE